jgi:iron complex transport system permease protein
MIASRPLPLTALLLGGLVGALLLAVLAGGAPGVGLADAWGALVSGVREILSGELERGTQDPGRADVLRVILFEVRLPRSLLLALAGAALAASGVALQACLQNPLADPGLLGVSAGASLGAVIAYSSGLALTFAHAVPLLAFAGGLAAILLVYVLAHAAGRPTTGVLLLTGVAVASLCSAVVSVLLVSTGDHRVHEMVAWLLGSAEGRSWIHLRMAIVPVAAGIAGLGLAGRLIDALALGEEQALGLGVDVLRARALLLSLVALTAGGAVAVVGPVGFVGLMVPHMIRGMIGARSAALLPAAATAGALLLVLGDVLSRMLSRFVDVPIGVITALIGVPFFLTLLHRARVR